MKATTTYIQNKFEEFNQQIFAGKLPPIAIGLSDVKTYLGRITYRRRITPDGKLEFGDFKLSVNTRVDLPEQAMEDLIIHEMIHYYIAFNRLNDASVHGPLFLRMMNEINQKHNRQIFVSYKGDETLYLQLADTRPKYQVIAVVSFKDGRKGIKVLPRVRPTLLNYYNRISRVVRVQSVELYMSQNPYFNRFPNSGVLKVHYLEESILNEHLKDAERMECDGTYLGSPKTKIKIKKKSASARCKKSK